MNRIIGTLVVWSIPAVAFAQEAAARTQTTVGSGGVSAIWVLANICYAGMRAQSNPSRAWRIVAFIFGLPGTIITYLAVKEGSERAYGIDIPRKH